MIPMLAKAEGKASIPVPDKGAERISERVRGVGEGRREWRGRRAQSSTPSLVSVSSRQNNRPSFSLLALRQ